tara:strand:- start:320 stop:571 length:252 start_codon:yes stop_codon:yes gene_type:complete
MVATPAFRVMVHGLGVKKYGHLVVCRVVEDYLWVGSVVGLEVIQVPVVVSLVVVVEVDTVVVVVVPRMGMYLVVVEGLLSTQV